MNFYKNLIPLIVGLFFSEEISAQVFDPCEMPAQNDITFTTYDASIDVLCFIGCATGFIAPSLDPSLFCGSWDFGDESSTEAGAVLDQIHCYNTPGVYQACLTISCCADPSISIESCLVVVITCGETSECYVRSSFWNENVGYGFSGDCVVMFDAEVFIGPNMVSYQNTVWTLDSEIISNENSATALLPSGVYNVCHSVDGVNYNGNLCAYSSCRNVTVNCCDGVGGNDNCSDITGDGVVTIADLLQLLSAFGLVC